MNVVYVPTVCRSIYDKKKKEKVPSKFEGNITLRMPTIDEKYEYMDESGYDVGIDDNGKPKVETSGYLGKMRRLLKMSYPHYVTIDVTRVKDKKKFTKLEELKVESDCSPILVEIASKLIIGFTDTKE